MNLYLNTTALDEAINPAEEERLRRHVSRSNVGCLVTTIQTAVTTADMVYGEDWSQEARKLLREIGLTAAPQSVMYATK